MEILKQYKNENFLQVVDDHNLEDLIEFSQTVNALFVAPKSEERDDMASIFNIFFNDIDETFSIKEGLEHFYQNRYDLIIVSTQLPQDDAVSFIEEIRHISRNITILALSAKEKYFIDFIRLGIDGYILHPIEVDQFVQIIHHVIEKLLNKQRLFEYRRDLEKMVRIKTNELQKINKKLSIRVDQEIEKNQQQQKQLFQQAKMASLGEMISNIAHQWRQPLSVVTTAASTVKLTSELGILEKNKCEELMDQILHQSNYLSKTIETFRNFIKNNKEYVVVDIYDKLHQAYTLVKPILNENEITLLEDIDYTRCCKIKTIKGELPQVLINIFNNAKDALVENSVQNPWIKVAMNCDQNNIYLSIEDNGGGIPHTIIDHIFDPYFTTKHKAQGTGLGLHMSYRIVCESLNGSLDVKNTTNGALFTIQLPLVKNN